MKLNLILNIIVALFIYEWVIKISASVLIKMLFDKEEIENTKTVKKTWEQRMEEMANKRSK